MKFKLQKLVDQGGNCVNLGRTIKSSEPELYDFVFRNTAFLNHKQKIKFNERVYCILNNIVGPVMDNFGKEARFKNLFSGYSLKEYTHSRNVVFNQKCLIMEQKRKINDEEKQYKEQNRFKIKIERYSEYRKKLFANLYKNDYYFIGWDYVICPITGERFDKITRSYIEQVLEMSVDDYNDLFPDILRTSRKHRLNISKGVQSIDAITGKPKCKIAQEKAKEKLSNIDPTTGLSGYAKKGLKTKSSHMSNIDENGRNGYQRSAYNRKINVKENGLTVEANSHKKRMNTLRKREQSNTRASKASKTAFKSLLNFLNTNNIKYYFDTTEYCVKSKDGNSYFYDLTIPDLKMAFEYQSDAFHAYPWMKLDEWEFWKPALGKYRSPDDVLKYDYKKAKELFEQRGIMTFHIWEKTVKNDIDEALCLLKTMYMKS